MNLNRNLGMEQNMKEKTHHNTACKKLLVLC